ncbi:MAG: hypothetical protein J6M07_08610, partial [Ruminococcus sp.]|nr:hypothetical protein [Ruminococcus sp.]
LKLRSSTKDQYLVGLYTNDPLGDIIIDRLYDNDNLLELNNLCEILDKASDRDNIMRCILNSDVRCINGIKKLFADRFMEFSDKLVLNTSLERKPTELAVKGCIIEKAIPVNHRRFEDITRAPLRDEPLIAENKDIMYFDRKGNKYHCILIYDIDYGDGIVIEAEGNDYAQYAQYVPQAKTIYEQYRATHLNELRFCCPIEIYQHIKDYPKDNCILDNADMVGYVDDINSFIRENDLPAEHERGLMLWYHPEGPDDEITEKVYSAHCTVEVINGELTGVITAKIIGELSDESMERFTDYCVGQLSDGWGESLEQKYMRTEGGEINISFWSDDEAWTLVPEDEYIGDNTQDMEMSM